MTPIDGGLVFILSWAAWGSLLAWRIQSHTPRWHITRKVTDVLAGGATLAFFTYLGILFLTSPK